MIHICMSLYDPAGDYSIYTAGALSSLLMNTKSKVSVHLLHDETVSSELLERFNILINKHNALFSSYLIRVDDSLAKLRVVKALTVGTVFRLYMTEVLPDSIERIIYIDSDIVVNTDIRNLWDTNLGNAVIGARLDKPHDNALFSEGVLDAEEYINAGVMLMDLKSIRNEMDFYRESLSFLTAHPNSPFLDQDAINYVCRGRKRFFSNTYNMFTIDLSDHAKEESAVYHFAGDKQRYMDCRFIATRLFAESLWDTSWKNDLRKLYEDMIDQREKRIQAFQCFIHSNSKKKVIWGIKGKQYANIMKNVRLTKGDYYVDNNRETWGALLNEYPVCSPDEIRKEKANDIIVIVTSMHYSDIKEQLKGFGLIENQSFIDGRVLL